jgi:hypothetical protein
MYSINWLLVLFCSTATDKRQWRKTHGRQLERTGSRPNGKFRGRPAGTELSFLRCLKRKSDMSLLKRPNEFVNICTLNYGCYLLMCWVWMMRAAPRQYRNKEYHLTHADWGPSVLKKNSKVQMEERETMKIWEKKSSDSRVIAENASRPKHGQVRADGESDRSLLAAEQRRV